MNNSTQYSFIVKYFKLEAYFKHLLLNNYANANPYHNLQHTLNVINLCFEIASAENLTYAEIRKLLVAAIFHDFDYSLRDDIYFTGENFGNEALEDYRIKESIASFRKIYNEEDVEEIVKLINSTHTFIVMDRNKLEEILYDADRLCWTTDYWVQDVFINLFQQELGMGWEKSLQEELNYLSNLKLYTHRAKEIYAIEVSSKLNEIKFLIKLLNES